MPTASINEMLQPYSHQNFYRLARALHYELGLHESKAAMATTLALRVVDLCSQHRIFVKPDAGEHLRIQLVELSAALNALVYETRQSSYRCHRGEDFQPYDDSAWDRLLSELTATVSAHIQKIRQLVDALTIPEFLPPSEVPQMNLQWIENFNTLKSDVKQHLNHVESLLDEDAVELWIRNLP